MTDFLQRVKMRLSPRSETRNRFLERRKLRIKAWDEVERINYFYPKD